MEENGRKYKQGVSSDGMNQEDADKFDVKMNDSAEKESSVDKAPVSSPGKKRKKQCEVTSDAKQAKLVTIGKQQGKKKDASKEELKRKQKGRMQGKSNPEIQITSAGKMQGGPEGFKENILEKASSKKTIQFCKRCGSRPVCEVKGQLERLYNQIDVLLPNTCVICYCPIVTASKKGQHAGDAEQKSGITSKICQESVQSVPATTLSDQTMQGQSDIGNMLCGIIKQNETGREVGQQRKQHKPGKLALGEGESVTMVRRGGRVTITRYRDGCVPDDGSCGQKYDQNKSRCLPVVLNPTDPSDPLQNNVHFANGTAPEIDQGKDTLSSSTSEQDHPSGKEFVPSDNPSQCQGSLSPSECHGNTEDVKKVKTEPEVITALPHYVKAQYCDNKEERLNTNIKPSLKAHVPITRNIPQLSELKEQLIPEIAQMLGPSLSDTNHCRCLRCDSDDFDSNAALLMHMSVNHGFKQGDKRWQCKGCLKKFDAAFKLRNHRCYYVHGERKFACGKCDMRFSYEVQLKKHNYRVHEKRWECSTCGKKLGSTDNLRVHMQRDHYKVAPFQCRYCPKKWYTEGTRKKHENFCHLGKKSLKMCEICGVVINNINAHSKIHIKVRNFACQQCPYKAKQLKALQGHMRRVHERTRNNDNSNRLCGCRRTEDGNEAAQNGEFKGVEEGIVEELVPKYVSGPAADTMLLGGVPELQRSVEWYRNILKSADCNQSQNAQGAGQQLCWALLMDEVSELTVMTHNFSGCSIVGGKKITVPRIDSGLLNAIFQQAKIQFSDFPCIYDTDKYQGKYRCKTLAFLSVRYGARAFTLRKKYGS